MRLHQLAFDFTFPISRPKVETWPIKALVARYRIPPSQAAIYAQEMRWPISGVCP